MPLFDRKISSEQRRHFGNSSDPKLNALRNLQTGEVHNKGTSYVGEQNEVRDMVRATKDPNIRWPGLWYEIRQGAEDFNDWSQGSPGIDIYYQGQSEPVSIYQFAADRKKGTRKKVEAVAVSNYIRGDEGLRPGNVVLTLHEEKSEATTLGQHGRGLKIGTTAVCAGGLGSSVSFESCLPEIGSWYGEASLVADPVDKNLPPNLQLNYKRDTDLKVGKTVVTVHEPSEDALEALVQLPEWFLPTNPRYESQRLVKDQDSVKPNLMTVYADTSRATGEHKTSFDRYQLRSWNGTHLDSVKGTEPPRVEILSKEILPNLPPTIDFVFVDGLKVKVTGAKYSQVFSFWGFGKCSGGSDPHRSNDSLRLEGSVDKLVSAALGRCDNPTVFAQVIEANMSNTATSEGNISQYQFSSDFSNEAGPKSALAEGWKTALAKVGAPEGSFITSSRDASERAKRETLPTVYLNSSALVEAIKNNVPGVVTVDSIFEKKAAEDRQKAAQELANERARHEAQLREQKARNEELLRQAMHDRGVAVEARDTGEVIKVANPENTKDSAEIARLHLIYALGLDNGEIGSLPKKPNSLVLNMDASTFGRLPNNTDDLGHISPFVKNFLVAYGQSADVEIRVVKNGKGVFFNFARSDHPDNFGNLSIAVHQGVTDMPDNNLLQIIISPKQTSMSLLTTVESFRQQIKDAMAPISGQDGRVNRELYLNSEHYRRYPPAEAAIRARRQLEEAKKEAQAGIAAINAARIKAHLAPIEDPFAEKESATSINRPKFAAPNAPRYPQPHDGAIATPEEKPGKNKPKEDRHFDDGILDDIPIIQKVLSLIHPDSVPGISTSGEKRRREIIMDDQSSTERVAQSLMDRIQEALRRRVSPDFTLASGEFSKTRGYLISHFNPAYSEISSADYEILDNLEFAQRNSLTRLRFDKAVLPGLNTLMTPPGYRPVAYHHPSEHPEIIFSGNEERNVFAFSNEKAIPAGLTIYYEKTDHIDTSVPDAREKEVIADYDGLNDYWKDLVTSLNNSPDLTDKNKADILLRAWTKAFVYDDSQETFDLYKESRSIPKKLATDIINNAAGNCGYSDRGYHGLLSLVGIPSRDVACFLSDGMGNFSRTKSYHGINQPYLDGSWVYVEPQAGYLQPGYEIEDIPVAYRNAIEPLLGNIPEGSSKSPRFVDGLPEALPSTMPPIRDLAGDLVDAVLENLPMGIPDPRELIGGIISGLDMAKGQGKESNRKSFKEGLKLAGAAGAIATIAYVFGPTISQFVTTIKAAEPIAQANPVAAIPTPIPPTPMPTVTAPTGSWGGIQMPQINFPQIHFPKITMPQINLPQIEIPQVHFNSPEQIANAANTPAVQEAVRGLTNIPPEYVAIAVLIGASAFTAGVFYERNRRLHPKTEKARGSSVPSSPAIDYNLQ